MELIERLRRIHDANFAGDHGPFSPDDVRAYLNEDGFERDEDVPGWFRTMIELVDRRSAGSGSFQGDGGSMGGLLQELHNTHGWDVDDYGEGIELAFPASKVRVFVSREALDPNGRSCHSYAVALEDGAAPAAGLFESKPPR